MKKQKAEGRKQKAESRKQKRSGPPRKAGDVRLSEHPRAKHQIAVAKGWGGLIGLGLAGYVTYGHGLGFLDVAIRALGWGLAAYLLVWFCAVQVWRHLAVAEVRSAEKLWRERRVAQERAADERRAEIERTAVMAGGRPG
jgi:hypothetical protein